MLHWSTCASTYLSSKLICKPEVPETRNNMTITTVTCINYLWFCHTVLHEHMCICMVSHAQSLLTFWISSALVYYYGLYVRVLLESYDSEPTKISLHLPRPSFVWLVYNGHQFDGPSVSATAVFVEIRRHLGLSLSVLQKHVEVQHEQSSQRWLKILGYTFFLMSNSSRCLIKFATGSFCFTSSVWSSEQWKLYYLGRISVLKWMLQATLFPCRLVFPTPLLLFVHLGDRPATSCALTPSNHSMLQFIEELAANHPGVLFIQWITQVSSSFNELIGGCLPLRLWVYRSVLEWMGRDKISHPVNGQNCSHKWVIGRGWGNLQFVQPSL